MEELDLLIRAKGYIDKLANGINPLTDEEVAENDVVNNVRLSRCFFYVSGVLQRVIESGIPKKSKSKLAEFRIDDESLEKFEYSDEPISITHIARRINNLIDQNTYKGLSFKVLNEWLKAVGMLEDANGKYGNARQCPTDLGKELGISIEKRITNRSEYYAVYYNRNAQQFIINHLQGIIQN